MKVNKYLDISSAVIINLKSRPEKRAYMEKQFQGQNIKYDFFSAEKHNDPKRGCLESHISVIKNAIKNNDKTLLIMEDDCKYIKGFGAMEKLPDDWSMIYLGGTVHRILDRKYKGYARVQCWTTHAYILNLTNKAFVDKLLEVEWYEGEIDRYYLEKIHPNFNAYMCDPMIAIQKEGFSDIENKEVSYDFMIYTLNGLFAPEYNIDSEGNYVLKLDSTSESDLPSVSIITPTYKRRAIFSMAIFNFENFNYPKNKMEWIIVDDSPEDENVCDLLPKNKNIKFISMPSNDGPNTIAMKRNIGVSNSSHSIIIHMDDDDYYPPESILARVKILLKYKSLGIECCGSTLIGTYNLLNNESSMSSDGPISLSEASMAYTKKFWEERPFDELCVRGEHKSFTEQRLNKIIDIPYSFVLIAINHKSNFTDHLRGTNQGVLRYSNVSGKEGETANFFDTWDYETQIFIMELRNYIIKIKN